MEFDGRVSPKSDKTYVDAQLALKANQLTTYTNKEVDTALGLKAGQSSTNTKTEVYGLVSPKSDKTYVDTQLALKANQLTTYEEEKTIFRNETNAY